MSESLKLAFSVEEAANAASIGRTLVFEEIRNKRLVARKVGRRTVIAAADLAAWLNSLPRVKGEVA